MTAKNSIKATLSGVGASLLSFAGICCGGGACAAACGTACAAPVASILGFSTAGFSTWAANLLPLFTALSAIAFTVAYYSLYKTPKAACCEPAAGASPQNTNSINRFSKPAFWIGLLLTLGFYGNAIAQNLPASEEACCEAELIESDTPVSCSATKTSCTKK